MKFNYQSRTQEGRFRQGTVEASSKEAALDILSKYGLYVTFLEEISSAPFYTKKIKIFGGVSSKDLVLFSRQLAILFKSKVPLVESLHTLANQMRNLDFKEKILKLGQLVEGGNYFSSALANYPKIFSSLFVSMIKSGEASGKLSEALDYLANHLEREYDLSSKVKGAMVYPIFILFFFVIIISLMVTYVVPELATFLKDSAQELPAITKVLISGSDFLRIYGWVVVLVIFAFFFFLFRYSKTESGKESLDAIFLKIPLVNDFFKKVYLARFSENLSTLISGGLSIVKALEISADIVGNVVYKAAILETRDGVRRGESINSTLAKYPEIFPSMLIQMTLVGETTGSLDSSLMNIVNFYQKEIDRAINSFLSILEPMIIVVLGVVVAIFAVAVILPIQQMGTQGM